MAILELCCIEGCRKPAAKGRKGMCLAHYKRERRHGDPNAGRSFDGEGLSWLFDHISHNGNECLFWPFGGNSNGYGTTTFQGKQNLAHRIMCFLKNGHPPTDKHEAAHSCGNGHLGCVNPNHLSWKTHSENELDKVRHGTHRRGERHPLATLSAEQVREIYKRAWAGESHSIIAKEFDIGSSAVSNIKCERVWRFEPKSLSGDC